MKDGVEGRWMKDGVEGEGDDDDDRDDEQLHVRGVLLRLVSEAWP